MKTLLLILIAVTANAQHYDSALSKWYVNVKDTTILGNMPQINRMYLTDTPSGYYWQLMYRDTTIAFTIKSGTYNSLPTPDCWTLILGLNHLTLEP